MNCLTNVMTTYLCSAAVGQEEEEEASYLHGMLKLQGWCELCGLFKN